MSAAESVLLAWDVDRFALDTDSYTEAVLVAGYDRGLLTDAQMEAALEALEQDLSNTVDIHAVCDGMGVDLNSVAEQVAVDGRAHMNDGAADLIEAYSHQVPITKGLDERWQRIKVGGMGYDQEAAIVVDTPKGQYLADNLIATDQGLVLPAYSESMAFAEVRLGDDRYSQVEPLLGYTSISLYVLAAEGTKYAHEVPATVPEQVLVVEHHDEIPRP